MKKAEKLRDFCRSMQGKEITCSIISQETGLDVKYCSTAMSNMRVRGEVEITRRTKGPAAKNVYKVISIKNSKTFSELATAFLNQQETGFIFNLNELANAVECSEESLKYFLKNQCAAGSIGAIKGNRQYRYIVREQILKINFKSLPANPAEGRNAVNKDNLYLFAYSGNAEVIRDNLHY